MKKMHTVFCNQWILMGITCCIFLSLQTGCRETESGAVGNVQPSFIAAPVARAAVGQHLSIHHINTHDGYSEAVTSEINGVKTIYVSGQIGKGDSFEAQMRSALSNLEATLDAAGANMNDIVKMNTYIVDYTPETLEVFRRVRKELMGELKMPASTLAGVQALALPDWKIEIEAIAIVSTE